MSVHDHSSIRITIEMPDIVCLRRQFQTSLSHHLLPRSATECSDLKSAALAVACPSPATTKCLLSLAEARREATLLGPLRVQQRAGHQQWRVD